MTYEATDKTREEVEQELLDAVREYICQNIRAGEYGSDERQSDAA